MSNIFRNAALALALLAGTALAAAPAMAGDRYYRHWGWTNMYTNFHNTNKPRHAFPQYGPVYRGPGYAYYGPRAYYAGVPYRYVGRPDAFTRWQR